MNLITMAITLLIGSLSCSTATLHSAALSCRPPLAVLRATAKTFIQKKVSAARCVPPTSSSCKPAVPMTDAERAQEHVRNFKALFAQFPPGLFSLIRSYVPEVEWYAAPYQSPSSESKINPLGAYLCSPDQQHAAFIKHVIHEDGSSTTNIVVVITATNEPIFTRILSIEQPHPYVYSAFAWSHDGTMLCYKDGSNIVVVNPFSAASDPLFTVFGNSFAWSYQNHSHLAITGYYDSIDIYDMETNNIVRGIQKTDRSPCTPKIVLWNPQCNALAALSRGHYNGGNSTVYNATTGKTIYSIPYANSAKDETYTTAAFSLDGSQFALGCEEYVSIYDAHTGVRKLVRRIINNAAIDALIWLDDTILCARLKPVPPSDCAWLDGVKVKKSHVEWLPDPAAYSNAPAPCDAAIILDAISGTVVHTLKHNQPAGYSPFYMGYAPTQRQLTLWYEKAGQAAVRKTVWQPDWTPAITALPEAESKESKEPATA